jgi:hypothetical protein
MLGRSRPVPPLTVVDIRTVVCFGGAWRVIGLGGAGAARVYDMVAPSRVLCLAFPSLVLLWCAAAWLGALLRRCGCAGSWVVGRSSRSPVGITVAFAAPVSLRLGAGVGVGLGAVVIVAAPSVRCPLSSLQRRLPSRTCRRACTSHVATCRRQVCPVLENSEERNKPNSSHASRGQADAAATAESGMICAWQWRQAARHRAMQC